MLANYYLLTDESANPKMTNYLIITIALALFLIIIIFIFKAISSRQGQSKGLLDNKLHACLGKYNCVCSEFNSEPKVYVKPLQAIGTVNEIEHIQNIIQQMNGEVVFHNSHYVSATFKSKWFRFVDDFELRIDVKLRLIQLRSESRVGRNDFGVNRKRIERFCEYYNS